MISHLFICSPRGDVIAIKQYRDDIPGNIPELFFDLIKDSRESICPVIDRWVLLSLDEEERIIFCLHFQVQHVSNRDDKPLHSSPEGIAAF